jgi:starch synthase
MRLLLASSEVHPFSKTGGLADMVGALAKYVAREGHEVALVTPLYRGVYDRFPSLRRMDWLLDFPMGWSRQQGEVWSLEAAERLTVYFIGQPHYFDRPSLYQEHGVEYADNCERFIFFSKSVVNLARHLPAPAQVVHVHDWQTGLVPLFVRHQREHEDWATAPATCLTIHNLEYQGRYPAGHYDMTTLPWSYFHGGGAEFGGLLNCLKAGIEYADLVTTVSPRYAREITTEQYGAGLDGVLRRRQHALLGILNGVDEEEWTPVNNPHLEHSFHVRSMAGKAKEKLALQEFLGLPQRPHTPLFGTVSRLVHQKGVDLELGALEEMLSADLQFVLLGSGPPHLEKAFVELARRYPDKVAVHLGFDQALSHRIEAACDFYLMPSRFEPCGLNQMYSLRYGTIPIVRVTGGLDDSVVDAGDDAERANGIKFAEPTARALSRAIRKALILYQNPEALRHFRRNAMKADFSWERTARLYVRVYERLLAGPSKI